MALQLGALRDALIEAGSTPETANRASEELAAYDRQFVDVRNDIRDLASETERQFLEARQATDRQFAEARQATDRQFAEMRSDIKLLKWMLGTLLAIATAGTLRVFIH